MKFEPGKNREGHIPLHPDGKPVFAVSGPYTICRAITGRGYLFDAYVKGEGSMADNLDGGLPSFDDALKLCEAHNREHAG